MNPDSVLYNFSANLMGLLVSFMMSFFADTPAEEQPLYFQPAVSEEKAEESPTGYIRIKSDTLGTPAFIDGVFIGHTPVNHPVPVLPGKHEVSLFPSRGLDDFTKNRLVDSYKKVFVAEGDTVNVMLYFDFQTTRIEAIRQEQALTEMVAYCVIGIISYLLWTSAGS
ncbi:MAG: hypothetical protein QGH89_06555 [Candidatus Marinimicrobia bacterium]|nr:hypothetical protein [Candidatus Neomarinimicrobiota bacterium]